MKKTILALAVMLSGYAASAQNTGTLLSNYIRIKNALVSSDSKMAAAAARTFYEGLKNEGDFDQKADLLKAAANLDKTGVHLEKQRAAFSDLSARMWKLVKGSGKPTQAVYYQYCPMKKTYWISTEKEIRNPYFGASMLGCGTVQETKS